MNEPPQSLELALADRYTFERKLGVGGMATVYLAHDLKHDRKVAIKVMRPELSAILGAERFLREVSIAAKLNHPHILPLYDSGQADDFLYYVMPYVAGESLRGLLNRKRQLPLERALAIAKEVADALSYAHRSGVVHRDIKPENILLSEGHAVVADFGIAKAISTAGGDNLTRTGFPLGTPGYMSPEQATGSKYINERTDVFSLACVCYEMLVGEPPQVWPTEEDVRLGYFTDAPPGHRAKLDLISGSVEHALVKAMAQRPRHRLQTPNELVLSMEQPASRNRQYSDTEARRIIQRAAEMQAEQPTDEGALSIGGVERIAAEVGIPPERVQQAVHAPEQRYTGPESGGVLGLSSRVFLERVIEHEIAEGAFESVLEDIRSTLGEAGRINPTLGKSLSWNSLSFQNSLEGSGRLTQVSVSPKGGRTKIFITESSGTHAILLFAAVTAVSLGALPILANTTDLPGGAIVAIAVAIFGGATIGARSLLQRFTTRRQRILSSLMDRIAGHVVESGRRLPTSTENTPDEV